MFELAERAKVPRETWGELVASAAPSELVCAHCAVPMRRVRLRGVPVDVCRQCGDGWIARGVRARLEGTDSNTERPLPPAVQSSHSPISTLDRARWATAPLVGIAVLGAVGFIVERSPMGAHHALASAALALVTPAPAALAVRLVVPWGKDLAASLVAVAAAIVFLCLGVVRDVPAAPLAVVAFAGGALGVVVAASRRALGRTVLLAVAALTTSAGAFKVHALVEEQRRAGCPVGATWDNHGGRHCALQGGRWHGPGERAVGAVVLERGEWSNGLRQGPFTIFRLSGERAGEGAFVADREEGPWLLFESGVIAESGSFKAGEKDGTWTRYDSNGKPTSTVKYVKGLVR
jgi:hypothetical protein